MMGLGSNAATTASTHSGGMMGGMWRMMGDHGLVANGGSFFIDVYKRQPEYCLILLRSDYVTSPGLGQDLRWTRKGLL